MSAPKGLLKGDKFNGRQQTLIDEARPLIKVLRDSPLVKKISIGIIMPCTVGPVRVKAMVQNNTVSIKLRGHTATQQFYAYGSDGSELSKIVTLVEGAV